MSNDNETKSRDSQTKSDENIEWHDVCHLPKNHPKMKRFLEKMDREAEMMKSLDWTGFLQAHNEEGSLAEFDRYIAGDR